MNTFCTIITADYFPRALALYKSIAKYDQEIELQVLIADNKPVAELPGHFPKIKIFQVSELSSYPLVTELYNKYAHVSTDFFRWSLKPILISYLLKKGWQKILYLDCDMYFVNDYHFLFDELDYSSVLLTPHWRNKDPLVDEVSFFSLFRSGIFTAGFVGANQKSRDAMEWWANACHFLMGEHPSLGIHDDQRYLDILPVYYPDTKIIRHRGCTIGAWQYEECKRVLVNGEVRINGEYPVIFIHFEEMLVSQILKGHDELLLPYLNEYKEVFEQSGQLLSGFIKNIDTYTNATALHKLKWNLRLRTRLKKFIHKLAGSI
ncbi:MAG: hypothetical protein ABIR18_00465 [Chitinophagaceae bacterium]